MNFLDVLAPFAITAPVSEGHTITPSRHHPICESSDNGCREQTSYMNHTLLYT